jgi:hypothetical protein
MILDTMTYAVMAVIAVWTFIVILLAWLSQGRHHSSDK